MPVRGERRVDVARVLLAGEVLFFGRKGGGLQDNQPIGVSRPPSASGPNRLHGLRAMCAAAGVDWDVAEHSLHFFVVAAAGFVMRAESAFIGITTRNRSQPPREERHHGVRKQADVNRRVADMKLAIRKVRFAGDGPIKGVRTSLVSEATTAPNAPPMMTPPARSTTFPRIRKFLNPVNIGPLIVTAIYFP